MGWVGGIRTVGEASGGVPVGGGVASGEVNVGGTNWVAVAVAVAVAPGRVAVGGRGDVAVAVGAGPGVFVGSGVDVTGGGGGGAGVLVGGGVLPGTSGLFSFSRKSFPPGWVSSHSMRYQYEAPLTTVVSVNQ
jgi:hypothetical protein